MAAGNVGSKPVLIWKDTGLEGQGEEAMGMEAEAGVLCLIGIVAVSLLEVGFGWVMLEKQPFARRYLVGHVLATWASFYFLYRIFSINQRLQPGIVANANTLDLGLFGICWAIGVSFVVALISCLTKEEKK